MAAAGKKILEQLGVQLYPRKTRIVHVQNGFEFLGYKIKRAGGADAFAPEQIQNAAHASGGAVCVPAGEINPTFHGPGARAHQTVYTAADHGADCRAEPAFAGVGELLQANPCPQALSPTRRRDSATHLVALPMALALQGLERIALGAVIRRVRTGQLESVNPVPCFSMELSLCESCMRENRTCRLSGGRWSARKRATSDPTVMKQGNACGAKGAGHRRRDR